MKNTFHTIVKKASRASGLNMSEYYKSIDTYPSNFTQDLKEDKFKLDQMKEIIEFYGGTMQVIVKSNKLGEVKCEEVAHIHPKRLQDACRMTGLTLVIRFTLCSNEVICMDF